MITEETRRKALHVLRTRGRAPVVLRGMHDDDVEALAALIEPQGTLKPGAIESYQAIMREHYDRLKATDAEFD